MGAADALPLTAAFVLGFLALFFSECNGELGHNKPQYQQFQGRFRLLFTLVLVLALLTARYA